MLKVSFFFGIFLIFIMSLSVSAQETRTLSGTFITTQFEVVPGVSVEVNSLGKTLTTISDAEGKFSIEAPSGPVSVRIFGKNIRSIERSFSPSASVSSLQIKIEYFIPTIAESVTITADALTPNIELRNDSVYRNTLFGRDDQLIQTLNAGINAGQHEGGGKSLEIRRYGFNLDHGGVNGGLKVVVDNIQQNQGTQGHGQGYLGALKSLSPELVEDVTIINGSFSAAYGDFSGLGVVQIRQREKLPTAFTARVQGGSFNTFRGFFAIPQTGRMSMLLLLTNQVTQTVPF